MRRWLLLGSALLVATAGAAGNAWAAGSPADPSPAPSSKSAAQLSGHESVIKGTKRIVRLDPTYVGPRARSQARALQPLVAQPATAKINVTYIGFSAPARAAFQAAVNIWQTQIHSIVPIDVIANWSNLTQQYNDPSILGAAGPTDYVDNFSNAPLRNVYYPIALANAIQESDLLPANDCDVATPMYNPSGAEITASFNSAQPAWYYGTDGNPGPNQADLESVVLHELGHGLGFVGTFDVPDPSGTGNGVWGLDGHGNGPTIFDEFAGDAAGQALMNTSAVDSPQLGQFLLGQFGGPQWIGAAGISAAGGTRPLLYAPSPFQEGSSFSHLDEATYPAGSGNALMTPAIHYGEVEHSVGPIVRGMFQDMGWPQTGSPYPIGDFHPVTPMRLVSQQPMTALQPLDIPILGVGGVGPVAVKSVVVDVTVQAPSTIGIWTTRPAVCMENPWLPPLPVSQNYQAGLTRTMQTILPLDYMWGHQGKIQIWLDGSSNTTMLSGRVTVDLVGWYDDGGFYENGGDSYHQLPGPAQAFSGTVTPTPVDVKMLGLAGIPASGVSAVVVSAGEGFGVTPGFLYVGPGGSNTIAPTVAYSYAELTQNLAIVPLGSGAGAGKIRLRVNTGHALATLKVVGWYGPQTAGGMDFHSDGPARLSGAPRGQDVTIGGLPPSTPVLLNVHIGSPTANSVLSAAPGGSSVLAAVQEIKAHQNISGRSVVMTNTAGQVRLHLSAGTAIFYTDLEGWFSG